MAAGPGRFPPPQEEECTNRQKRSLPLHGGATSTRDHSLSERHKLVMSRWPSPHKGAARLRHGPKPATAVEALGHTTARKSFRSHAAMPRVVLQSC